MVVLTFILKLKVQFFFYKLELICLLNKYIFKLRFDCIVHKLNIKRYFNYFSEIESGTYLLQINELYHDI